MGERSYLNALYEIVSDNQIHNFTADNIVVKGDIDFG